MQLKCNGFDCDIREFHSLPQSRPFNINLTKGAVLLILFTKVNVAFNVEKVIFTLPF